MSEGFYLLIFQHVPETTEFYRIPAEVYEQNAEIFLGAHNKFIGGDNDVDKVCIVSDAIGDPEYANDETPESLRGAWKEYEIGVDKLPLTLFLGVIVCGCFM